MVLPKHLRPRWRYLAVGVETWPDAALSAEALQRAVWEAARALLGDPGSADAVLEVLQFRHDATAGVGEAVVRVRRGEVTAARAALACVDRVGSDPVGLRVRGVSGTVRACEEKYLGQPAGEPTQTDVVFEDSRRPAVVRDGAVDLRGDDGFTGATDLDPEGT